MSTDPEGPRLGVVVPAHDEEAVIAASLDHLFHAAREAGVGLEVVVVPNGCSDRTAQVAASVPGAHVVELHGPGKPAALNAGDEACETFPRIYLDADVQLDARAVAGLAAALATDEPVVAAPRIHFDTTGVSLGVRAFYRIFARLPYATDDLVGLGVYGLSAAGRARFDVFPDLQADDLFVQRLFPPEERVVVDGRCTVAVPRDLRNLVKVRTRVARGNRELSHAADDERFASSSGSTMRALIDLVRSRPSLAPSAVVYLGIGVAARVRARRVPQTWDRDDSTRGPAPSARA